VFEGIQTYVKASIIDSFSLKMKTGFYFPVFSFF